MGEYKNLIEIIKDVSSLNDRGLTFIKDKETEVFVSFEEFYKRALKVLYWLQSRGISKGCELVFQIHENEHFLYVFWACLLGGIIPVPIMTVSSDEIRKKLFRIWKVLNKPYLIINSMLISDIDKFSDNNNFQNTFNEMQECSIFIDNIFDTDGNIFETEDGIINIPDGNDIAFIQFSSGTTGDPKGVVLTHDNLIANMEAACNGGDINENDSILSWMPLSHDMGIIGAHLSPTFFHLNQYFMPTQLFIKSPMIWMKKASEHRITTLFSPNFGYSYFLDHFSLEQAQGWDLSNIRLIYNGAEPISYELCNEFLNIMGQYGLHGAIRT